MNISPTSLSTLQWLSVMPFTFKFKEYLLTLVFFVLFVYSSLLFYIPINLQFVLIRSSRTLSHFLRSQSLSIFSSLLLSRAYSEVCFQKMLPSDLSHSCINSFWAGSTKHSVVIYNGKFVFPWLVKMDNSNKKEQGDFFPCSWASKVHRCAFYLASPTFCCN